jgi:DNA-binding GntR family transcriptional regulator
MSEKSMLISDTMKSQSDVQSLEKSILRRLRGRGRGVVACPSDFLDCGSRAAVDQVLSRLAKKGTLRRVDRGVYVLPKKSRLLGELSPAPEEVAQALARKGAQRVIPAGAHAANLLGLTTQVPARIEYLTDGPPRQVMVQNLSIILKRTTTRNLATAGRISGTVIQALRFLGQKNVNEEVIRQLRARLKVREKTQLLQDTPLAPAWMASVFRQVAASSAPTS